MTDRCKDCLYSKTTHNDDVLRCRRNPPILKPASSTTIDGFLNKSNKSGIEWMDTIIKMNSDHPEVSPYDWCGEFKKNHVT